MRIRNTIIALIFLLIPGILTFAHTQDPDYFPMNFGDKWIYELVSGSNHWADAVVTITDTVTIDSNKYHVYQWAIYDYYYTPDSILYSNYYYRKVPNGDIHRILPGVSTDQLYYTFQDDYIGKPYYYWTSPATLQDSSADLITLMGKDGLYITPAGTFNDCAMYEINFYHTVWGLVYGGGETIAPEVGLVTSAFLGDHDQLIGALIDGVVYGDTTMPKFSKVPSSNLTTEVFVLQCHPNPFNSTTTIRYYLPKSRYVTIKIFNLSGQVIKTLVNEQLPAGEFEIVWNAGLLPSGFYLCHFTAGEFVQTRKLLLIR